MSANYVEWNFPLPFIRNVKQRNLIDGFGIELSKIRKCDLDEALKGSDGMQISVYVKGCRAGNTSIITYAFIAIEGQCDAAERIIKELLKVLGSNRDAIIPLKRIISHAMTPLKLNSGLANHCEKSLALNFQTEEELDTFIASLKGTKCNDGGESAAMDNLLKSVSPTCRIWPDLLISLRFRHVKVALTSSGYETGERWFEVTNSSRDIPTDGKCLWVDGRLERQMVLLCVGRGGSVEFGTVDSLSNVTSVCLHPGEMYSLCLKSEERIGLLSFRARSEDDTAGQWCAILKFSWLSEGSILTADKNFYSEYVRCLRPPWLITTIRLPEGGKPRHLKATQECVPITVEGEHEVLNVEQRFVHEVYDRIASQFSHTRYKPWPKVAKVLADLPRGSIVVDVGCGNGKYSMSAQPGTFWVGSDRSFELLKLGQSISTKKIQTNVLFEQFGKADTRTASSPIEVLRADAGRCAIRSGIADLVISIAVIHHISTAERRIAVIKELLRVAQRNGGKVLIYVWAKEQVEGSVGARQFCAEGSDCMLVPWKTKEAAEEDKNATVFARKQDPACNDEDLSSPRIMRLYKAFSKAEILAECEQACENDCAEVEDCYFDCNNWAVILKCV